MTPEHWARLRAKTNDEINRAALSDPDAQPRTEQQLVRARRISFAKFTRQRLGMTQPQFAETFRIPLGTLRDWEQHRREPDQAARAYLEVIAREPKAVRRALAKVERTMSVGEAVE
jgi:putative transcriptional regulator